jgi:hypothetical protein
MHEPITINYLPDGDDWRVILSDGARTETASATGLIAARDQADQLVAKMTPGQDSPTVVHLLNGDAVAFTTQYLHARLGLDLPAEFSAAGRTTAPPPAAEPVPAGRTVPDTESAPAAIPTQPAEPVAEQAAVTEQAAPQQRTEPTAGGSSAHGDRSNPADGPVRTDAVSSPVAAEPAVSTGHLMAADSVETVIDKRAKPDGKAGAGESDSSEANQLTQVIKAIQ